ncbi:MAG: hypothetical protein HLUCCO17_07140 [Saliniramus fredricksonii]|uniref:Uncharacterized protein n=1 Tax=Saliniramus fredricksonii TaxID=1653334 RepID=A0A0P7XV87_9HYPH|nr:DUF6505 family protein [Saliniramus fredricksonii]KPQ11406.1 MAG: hypothetical protein HLUCCO17_07140 [Saliniramus fredricksonii]SCC81944.1 hypothetical protein GA0071312_2917 [Saliniramus fredricksonii]
MILLPRTIRLDASDAVVFARAAEPGEWAVPGTFLFAGRDPAQFSRKEQIAFRSGFLGVDSFGFSTLIIAQQASAEERAQMVTALARQLVAHLGAPSEAIARPAAEEEVALAQDLCRGHAENTLVALHRSLNEDGAIHEQFRTLKSRDETAFGAGYLRGHDRAFYIVESDEGEEAGDPAHHVDLLNLRGQGR